MGPILNPAGMPRTNEPVKHKLIRRPWLEPKRNEVKQQMHISNMRPLLHFLFWYIRFYCWQKRGATLPL